MDDSCERRRVVYLRPLEEGELHMGQESLRFRLTYKGELQSSQKDELGQERAPLAQHKQSIRRAFHPQLKQLWATNKFLRGAKRLTSRDAGPDRLISDLSVDLGLISDVYEPLAEAIANKYRRNGYRFVPLVCENFSVLCSLDVLFLRRDPPGELFTAGDLDNRVKTLIDALRIPKHGSELDGNLTPPGDGEDPFYCLLEEDKLVTGFSVETDTLLDGPTGKNDRDRREVQLIITVNIKPYDITRFNLSFA
ncbi:MAG: hypothetical protein WCF20_02015 [Methylovirgula sp.]